MTSNKSPWTQQDVENFEKFIEANGGRVVSKENTGTQYRSSMLFHMISPDGMGKEWGEDMMRKFEATRR